MRSPCQRFSRQSGDLSCKRLGSVEATVFVSAVKCGDLSGIAFLLSLKFKFELSRFLLERGLQVNSATEFFIAIHEVFHISGYGAAYMYQSNYCLVFMQFDRADEAESSDEIT